MKEQKTTSKNNITSSIAEAPFGFAILELIHDKNNKPADFICHEANASYAKFFGEKPNKIIFKSALDFFKRQDSDFDWFGFFEKSLNDKKKSAERYFKKTKKHIRIEVFSDKEGFLTVMLFDITEERKSILNLESETGNFINFFNASNDFNWITDEKGNIIAFNESVRKRLGYNDEELIGKSILLIHPKERQKEAEKIVKAMLKGKAEHCHIPIISKTGELIPVETRITKGKWNGKPALFGESKDISALKLSEEKFFKTFQASPDIIGLSDMATGEYIEVNQAFYDILGFTPKEVIGKKAKEVVRFDKRYRNPLLKKLKESGSIRNEEAVIYSKKGKPVNVRLSAEVIEIQDKKYNLTIASDITHLIQAEADLRESESALKDIFDTVTEGICYTTLSGRVISVNRALEEIIEIPREKLIGKSILKIAGDILTPSNIKKVLPLLRTLIKGEDVSPFEVDYKNKILTVSTLRNKNTQRLTGVIRDVTLQRNREKERIALSAVVEHSNNPVVVKDLDLRVIAANDTFAKAVGKNSVSEVIGKTDAEIFGLSYDAEPVKRFIHEDRDALKLPKDKFIEKEETIILPGGETRTFLAKKYPVYNEKGIIIGIGKLSTDITEIKKMAERLLEREEYLQTIYKTTPTGFWILNNKGMFTEVNDSYCSLTGYTRNEILQMGINDLDADETPNETHNRIKRIKETGMEVFEAKHKKKNGSIFPIEVSTRFIKETGELVCFGRDLTERKEAELKLRARERYLHTILHTTAEGFWIVNSLGYITEVNDAYCKMSGYEHNEILGKSVNDLDAEETHKVTSERIQRIIRNGSEIFEAKHRRKDGTVFPVEISSTFMRERREFVCFCRDLTERKINEEQIALFGKMLDNAPASITIHNTSGKFLFVNQATVEMHGYESAEEFLSVNLHDLDVPESEALLNERVRKIEEEGEARFEVVHYRKDGSAFPLEILAKKIEWRGELAILSIGSDITERKKAEQELLRSKNIAEENETRYRALHNASFGGIMIHDKGVILDCNQGLTEVTGYSMNELIGMDGLLLIAEKYRSVVMNNILSKYEKSYEVMGLRKNGEEYPLRLEAREIPYKGRNVRSVEFRDISEQKKAENALKEQNLFVNSLLRAIPVAVFFKDKDGRYLGCNDAFTEIMGVTNEEIKGKTVYEVWPNQIADQYHKKDLTLIRSGQHQTYEYLIADKNGKDLPVIFAKDVYHDTEGNIAGIIGAFLDISERKRAEESLTQERSLLRTIVDTLPDFIYTKDLESRFTVVNNSMVRFLNRKSSADFLGRTDHDFYPKRLADIFRADEMEVFRSGHALVDHEETAVDEYGNKRWLLTTKLPMKDGRGNIIGLIGIGRDITERKRWETDLQKRAQILEAVRKTQSKFISEENPKEIFDHLLKTVISLTESEFGFLAEVLRDSDGAQYKVNLSIANISWDSESEKLYEQLRNKNFEFKDLSNLAGLPVKLREPVISNQASNDARAKGLPHGHPIINTYMGIPITFGGEIIGVVGVVNRKEGYDISLANYLEPYLGACAGIIQAVKSRENENRAISALIESEEKFRQIAENVNEVFWLRDAENSRIIYINPAYEKVWGRSCKSLYENRHSFMDSIHEEDRQKVNEEYRSQTLTKFFDMEYRIIKPDNEIRWVHARTFPVKDLNGNIVRQAGIAVDITERKRYEEALSESKMKLATAVRTAKLGPWELDIASGMFTFNDEFYELYHTTVEREGGYQMTLAQYAERFVHPDDAAMVTIETQKAVVSDDPGFHGHVEHRIIYADGAMGYISVTYFVVKDAEGKTIKTIGVDQDITERKQAEAEREAAMDMLQSALAQSPSGIIIADAPDAKIRMVNEAALSIRGRSELPLTDIGMSEYSDSWQTYYPDGAPMPSEELPLSCAILKGETVRNRDMIIRNSLGESRHVLANASPIRNAAGEITAGIVVFHDITERKKAEEKLRLQSLVLDQIKDLVTITDLEGRITYVNQSEAEVMKYPAEELIGKKIDFYGEDIAKGASQNDILFTTLSEGSWRGEVINFDAEGKEHIMDCRTQIVLDENGNKIALCGITTDITERKLAEQELAHTYELMRYIIEHTRSAIAVHDKNLNYIYVSQRYLDEYKVKERDVIGRHHYEVFPDLPQKWRDVHQKALAGEISKCDNDPYYREDGTVEWTRWECRPWYERDGSVGGIIVYTEFITEQKRAEEEKEKLNAQLAQAQKMESVGRLAGGVAHDFNNMLGVILGHAELAMESIKQDEAIYKDLKQIKNAAERSADLTKQLLAFARKQTVAPKLLDLNETVEGMLKMLRRLIGEDVELIWIPGSSTGKVEMDPTQIDQILVNLCVNARDAIEGTGTIRIKTEKATLDESFCNRYGGFSPGNYAAIEVSDTGSGMDTDTLSHIFEPFFTTKETGKGTGLGLATIYGIIKQNKGFIFVESEKNIGTTFKIYLPSYTGKTELEKKDDKQDLTERGKGIILLVEDEPALLEMTTLMLESQGYTVMAASTPGEAIKLARECRGTIDLLLTDVIMPEMNGRDLAKNILSIYPGLKRLFMSGYTADVIAHHGVLDKGVHFIQKPFNRKMLISKIKEILNSEEQD